MAYAPGLSWVCALAVAGIVLTFGVLALLAGVLGLFESAAFLIIGALFATWGVSLWRRWSRGRQPGPKES
ncbi:MAG TPA: hypothetical protein VEG66_06390 [Thermoplasmata archaeon]|nr:hypothetical protein [Thermoplasmata archaeon]